MNNTTRKILVEIAITNNISKLKARFAAGKARAMYGSTRQAGLLKAYERLHRYLPDCIRDGLSFGECMIFNSWVQIYMLKLMGV